MQAPADSASGAALDGTGQLVVRNTLYLTVAQTLTVPLSILINALAAHYLGPEAFGYAYLATTLCAFGFLAVGWGHEAVLPAVVSRDRAVAGEMLGSSLVWRTGMSVVVYAALALLCYVLRYPAELQWALALTAVLTAMTFMVAACKDTIRGLERTDIPAYAHVGQHILATILVCGALVLGGKLRALLVAQTIAAIIVLVAIWRTLRPAGVGRLSVRWSTVKALMSGGTAFMVLNIAMALQPNVDAVFLSKLAPADVMGWFAVTRRLVGTLLLPATALIGALYPTLCRLYATNMDEFRQASNGALRSVSLIVAPIALGCALFPDIGVALFSRDLFRPAEDNLRVIAIYVALVYFSMPLGTAIMASGRQGAWSAVQCVSVVASLVLDPLLIPIFQRYNGNGGLGVCVAAGLSEALMIGCGLMLVPKGVIDRALGRLLLIVTASGCVMAIAAEIAKPLSSYVAAPVALLAYVAALWLTGGIDAAQIQTIRGAVQRRRLAKAVPAPSGSFS